ncbi:MAG: hypothetical protein ACRD2X_03350 [Vicinamibacteraceae bacterium]
MTWDAIMRAKNVKTARAIGVAATGVLGLIVVGTVAGCRSTTDARALEATETAAGPAGLPTLVSCRTGEQALVRPTVVNGQMVSQVECVSTTAPPPAPAAQQSPYAGQTGASSLQPLAYQQAGPSLQQPQVYAPGAPTVAQPAVYEPAATTAQEPRVVYEPEPEIRRSKRSWKKSAVIIGSSAAIGAGVGGATKGKKGALIGAAIGGGGAAIWDAVTR